MAEIKENKMGVMPVNKLLISMSLPMMISMIVQALYNVVDSIFVSRVSENAFTAVSLAFPVQSLMIAVAVGTGVGINALVSKSLGEKNFDDANRAANNGIFVTAISCLVFILFGIFGTEIFFNMQMNSEKIAPEDMNEILTGGIQYLSIVTICSFGIFGQIVMERLLQSTGRTLLTMITQGIGAIINIILDPILIFGYFGLPKMGVAGAAVATVIGQCIALTIAIIFNLKLNHDIHISFSFMRPDKRIIGKIYSVGLPSIVMQSIGSVMVFGMNKILMTFSTTATAVFGGYFKLQSFVFMPVFGLNNGMVPIVAYNYGAKKRERLTATIKLGLIYAVGIMLLGLLVFQLLPEQLLGFFDPSEEMLRIGVPALRIISLSFIFAGFCIVVLSVLQSLGHAFLSMLVSICRQLLVLLPVAYLFSKTGNVDLVWWSFPIAEVVSVTLSTIFYLRLYKNVILPLDEENSSEEKIPAEVM